MSASIFFKHTLMDTISSLNVYGNFLIEVVFKGRKPLRISEETNL